MAVENYDIISKLHSNKAIMLAVAIPLVLCKLLWKKWKNYPRNPFRDEFVRKPEPVELNQTKRDKVLKVGFKKERIPEDLDAIVIGSGIGGLTCAGCLSRSGKKVLVLEQHDRAGGSSHTYEEKGFEFDVGIHYVGELEPGSMNHIIFDVLTDGQLVWEEMNKEFDAVVLRKNDKLHKMYSYCAGAGDYEKRLMKYFPKEEKAIKKFISLAERCKKSILGYSIMKMLPIGLVKFLMKIGVFDIFFSGYNEMVETSVKEVLDEITENEELKFVLGYAFGDYGTFPSKAPFLLQGVLTKHFYDGAYYPRGGSSEIAYQMIPGIVRNGGAVLVRAPVNQIIVEEGKATGVKVFKNGIEHEIRAPVVVSTAGFYNTYQSLLGKSIIAQFGLTNICEKVDRGLACFQTLVGLNGTTADLGLKSCNYWTYGKLDGEKHMVEYLSLPREEAVNTDIPAAFVSFPSSKDSTWDSRHPGKSVCVIVTLLNWEWFEEWEHERVKKRGPVYENLKKSFQDKMLKLMLNIHPHLEDKIEYIDSGTPLSHKYYIGSPTGDIYGIDHTRKRFKPELGMELRPETKIPGLYLSGQDIFSCGVIAASAAGMMTSGAILGRNHFIDLFALMAKRKFNHAFKGI
uniref:all-trans-retinol 13,14-reductase-like n=1 Tax=Styela clava TaxID=7725 RepID=UPI001939E67B|nr:all-trans-retinol 13,14-reductase-like [Styela clava]